MKRWKVEARYQSGWGMGPTSWEKPSYHRTFLSADWYRRFRARYPTFGTMQVRTFPSRVSENLPRDQGSQFPWYARLLERFVWPPCYFIRNRYDGLRYGRDRDSMDW